VKRCARWDKWRCLPKRHYAKRALTGQLHDGTPFEASAVIAVRMPGDVNCDGKVNVKDAYIVAYAFGECPGRPRWNPLADENEDGKVDVKDYYIVCKHYGEFEP